MVYKYIEDLKVEFNAPVKYSRSERTYYYDGEGLLTFKTEYIKLISLLHSIPNMI